MIPELGDIIPQDLRPKVSLNGSKTTNPSIPNTLMPHHRQCFVVLLNSAKLQVRGQPINIVGV
jgi:hypothetical protein